MPSAYSTRLKEACKKGAYERRPPLPPKCTNKQCRAVGTMYFQLCYAAGIAGSWRCACSVCGVTARVLQQPVPPEQLEYIEFIRTQDGIEERAEHTERAGKQQKKMDSLRKKYEDLEKRTARQEQRELKLTAERRALDEKAREAGISMTRPSATLLEALDASYERTMGSGSIARDWRRRDLDAQLESDAALAREIQSQWNASPQLDEGGSASAGRSRRMIVPSDDEDVVVDAPESRKDKGKQRAKREREDALEQNSGQRKAARSEAGGQAGNSSGQHGEDAAEAGPRLAQLPHLVASRRELRVVMWMRGDAPPRARTVIIRNNHCRLNDYPDLMLDFDLYDNAIIDFWLAGHATWGFARTSEYINVYGWSTLLVKRVGVVPRGAELFVEGAYLMTTSGFTAPALSLSEGDEPELPEGPNNTTASSSGRPTLSSAGSLHAVLNRAYASAAAREEGIITTAPPRLQSAASNGAGSSSSAGGSSTRGSRASTSAAATSDVIEIPDDDDSE